MLKMKSNKPRDLGKKFGEFLSDFISAAGGLIIGYAFAVTAVGVIFSFVWGIEKLCELIFG